MLTVSNNNNSEMCNLFFALIMKIGNWIKLRLSSLIGKSSSVDMSTPSAIDLLEDRVKFKFYAAEKHLKILKELQSKGETPNNFEARVKWEIEIENLVSHLIGARDALLFRINDKFGLGLKIRDVYLKNVNHKLTQIGRPDILKQLNDLLDPKIYPNGSWLSILTEIRNTGTHRSIINVRFEHELKEDLSAGNGSSSSMRICFKEDPDSSLEIIPYLEDRIQKMKQLIQDIMQRNQILSTP